MSEHTPGPWGMYYDWKVPSIVAGDRKIALPRLLTRDDPKPWPGDKYDIPQTLANARLIAAAPEMYEALKRAYDLGLLDASPENDTCLACEVKVLLARIEGKEKDNE